MEQLYVILLNTKCFLRKKWPNRATKTALSAKGAYLFLNGNNRMTRTGLAANRANLFSNCFEFYVGEGWSPKL